MVWHPVKPRPGSLYCHPKQGTIRRKPLKISIYLHSLIPPKMRPIEWSLFRGLVGSFFLRPDFCWRMPRKQSSYLKEWCSAQGRKESLDPWIFTPKKLIRLALRKLRIWKIKHKMRKPKQVREVVHVGNKSFDIWGFIRKSGTPQDRWVHSFPLWYLQMIEFHFEVSNPTPLWYSQIGVAHSSKWIQMVLFHGDECDGRIRKKSATKQTKVLDHHNLI